ncbi:MAG: hypothetical protein A4E68_01742 [Syntrophaceae bacterium PtaB.Bin095]|nr:MAG: hypothetical protein A4E68_01742 [Syntrophaceae bacterium PtaB.Bin095]
MSNVVPLRLLRPRAQFARVVASPPYDVVNREEAARLAAGNPLSFLHVEKSEIDFAPSAADEAAEDRVYLRARENLDRFISDGTLIQDAGPCYYIYRQRMGDHSQSGIVAGISAAEYESGRIKKHELTRADKELERTRHVEIAGAQTGPVFVTYRAQEAIDAIVARITAGKPEYDFTTDDGIAHAVWVVGSDADIAGLRDAFLKVGMLYIADGHHRAAAAAAVSRMWWEQGIVDGANEACHWILAVLFPHDQLRILDYNRVVCDLFGLTAAAFLEKVGKKFRIDPDYAQRKPARLHEFGMYLDGRWFRLMLKRKTPYRDPVRNLDATILQEDLLRPVLGIQDPRTDRRIDFVGGIRGMAELERLVDSGAFRVAFALYPTTLEEMMRVADAGRVMPPKSTWFEPKLRSGLFVHRLW